MQKKQWKVLFTWKPEFEEKFDAASLRQYYYTIILLVGGKSLKNNTARWGFSRAKSDPLLRKA